MSNANVNVANATGLMTDNGPHAPHVGHNGQHGHDPHLAHHFDSPEQQIASGKLGMWVFLGTEILMFGGLFCAYSVYRHNHPEVFEYAHQYLDRSLGAINTAVLIASSFTMAWAVRAAQLNQRKLLLPLLALTILGGFGFMSIKAVEYHHKWEHHLWAGRGNNVFSAEFPDAKKKTITPEEVEDAALGGPHGGNAEIKQAHGAGQEERAAAASMPAATAPATMPSEATATTRPALGYYDPNAGTPDEAVIKPPAPAPTGLAASVRTTHQYAFQHKLPPGTVEMKYDELDAHNRQRVATFFGIYFVMTGLHGIHVLVGMSLIFWVLYRAGDSAVKVWALPAGLAAVGAFLIFVGVMVGSHGTLIFGVLVALAAAGWAFLRISKAKAAARTEGEFSEAYFAPVDLVGLYWHIVDLIWIFLFPLLYLIH